MTLLETTVTFLPTVMAFPLASVCTAATVCFGGVASAKKEDMHSSVGLYDFLVMRIFLVSRVNADVLWMPITTHSRQHRAAYDVRCCRRNIGVGV